MDEICWFFSFSFLYLKYLELYTQQKNFFSGNSCGLVVYPASAPGRGAGEPRGWEMRMGAGWEGELSEILLICAKKRVSARQR